MKRTSLLVCAAAIGLICVNAANAQGQLSAPAYGSLTDWILSELFGFFGPAPDDDGIVNSKN